VKTILTGMIVMLLIGGVFVIGGCGRAEEHGQTVSNAAVTTIQDILSTPQRYADRLVKVHGKIVTECPTGCWFEVEDGSGILYVDTKASGFAIPQRVGKDVTVEGVISTKRAKPMMDAQGAKIE